MSYGATYLWDFGDGETSTEINPVHVYAAAGTYTVTLSITLAGNTVVETKTDYVVVNPSGDIILQAGSNVQYLAQYEAWWGDTVDPFTSAWNTVDVPSFPPSFAGTVLTWDPSELSTCSIITTVMMPADPANGVIEFKVNNLVPETEVGNYTTVGCWIEGFGPPFNPNSETGGSVSVMWASDGRIFDYGGQTSGYPTFEAGDVIGMVADLYTNNLNFFKNGVFQFALNTPSPTIWPRVGIANPPA